MRSTKIFKLAIAVILFKVILVTTFFLATGCSSSGPEVRETSAFDWGVTWGGIKSDEATGVAVNDSGCVWVSSWFQGMVDFDPGIDVDEHFAEATLYAAISKFDINGQFLWARSWGYAPTVAYDIAVDTSGNSYTTGVFYDTIDFDPGEGVESREAVEASDYYLSKFDTDGNFQWVRTWGNEYETYPSAIQVDSVGNVWITGNFSSTLDFDPGPGVDAYTSDGESGAFLCHYDADGNYLWTRTWNGEADRVSIDPLGNAWVLVGPGLRKYNISGEILWESSGEDGDEGSILESDLVVDDSGYVWVTGSFRGTVDFDPGPGVEEHVSDEGQSSSVIFTTRSKWFLCKLKPDGDLIWVRTWDGSAWVLDADDNGNAWVTGGFRGTVDFDPGEGVIEFTSNETGGDIYQSKFDTRGNLLWTRVWGGTSIEYVYDTVVDNNGNSWSVGLFYSNMDFDWDSDSDNVETNDWYGAGGDAFLIKIRGEELLD